MERRKLVMAVAALLGCTVALAAAATSAAAVGTESFSGVIVASGTSGERVVVNSVVVARGVFTGVGRIVELPDLPSLPGVERDDLVFAAGTMHLLSTTIDGSFSIDPRTCVFSAMLQQTSVIQGGTGLFAHASGSGTATVTAHGIAARGPDGSCSEDLAALLDVDSVSSTGTLSF
jgi:hypothetical protein